MSAGVPEASPIPSPMPHTPKWPQSTPAHSHLSFTSEGSSGTPREAVGKSMGHSGQRPVSSRARCCTRRGWRLKVKFTLKVSPSTKRLRRLWEKRGERALVRGQDALHLS